MRGLKLLAVAGLAVSTAACVETVDSNYGAGNGYYGQNQAYSPYGSSYGPSYGSSYGSGYYAQPSYQPTYYAPTYVQPTRVVTQTQYVPVPTPVAVPQRTFPQQGNRSNDHRWDGNRNDAGHHDRPQASTAPTPAPQQPAANNGNQHRGNGGSRDRDGDGRPDRRG